MDYYQSEMRTIYSYDLKTHLGSIFALPGNCRMPDVEVDRTRACVSIESAASLSRWSFSKLYFDLRFNLTMRIVVLWN